MNNIEKNSSKTCAHAEGGHPKGLNIEKKRHYESAVVALNNEVSSSFSEHKKSLSESRGKRMTTYYLLKRGYSEKNYV